MPTFHYRVKPSFYRDSVALMRLSSALLAQPGISQAAVLMATPANLAALAESGFPQASKVHLTPDDLLLAVEGLSETDIEAALDWAESELQQTATPAASRTRGEQAPRTLVEGLQLMPEAKLAVISVPGEYAYAEALKALKAGLHVFLFSSGVTLEDELRLKQFATRRGLLMMGAECGTAIIGGVPLGFANVVRRGNIGLVAASGSGLQEVTCLIHHWGGGISHAIGTGGRDLDEAVGAITMLAGLQLLLDDFSTETIVLLSKPPAAAVASRVLEAAARATKPVIICFLGADPAPMQAAGLMPAQTLAETAGLALAAVGQSPPSIEPLPPVKLKGARRFVRGLFAGGTLCTEARLILQEILGPIVQPTAAVPFPAAHTCLDLGQEEYTRGRPHPMIDARLRAELLRQAVQDPHTAVVLLDVILGYGASLDPVGPLLEVIAEAQEDDRPVFIAHVCGTEDDPQVKAHQVARLSENGVIVAPTNAAAAQLTGKVIMHE